MVDHITTYDGWSQPLGGSYGPRPLNSGSAAGAQPFYLFERATDTSRSATISYYSYCEGAGETTDIELALDVMEIA